MAKVHKPAVPLRPVISMINTPTYHLSKYLDNLIRPYCPCTYTVKSSLDFVNKLKQINMEDMFFVSYDVVGLFTNIPVKTAIDNVCDRIFNSDDARHGRFPYTKLQLKTLLDLANNNIFSFNGQLYNQVDGVSMGNPLAPILADFFMNNLEETIFSHRKNFFPLHYYRYVDDTFCVFNNKDNAEKFLDFINTIHPNIKFTIEYEKDVSLAFLDTEVSH